MDFSFSVEEAEVGQLARTILGDLVTTDRLRQLESVPDSWDDATWAKMAQADLLGIGVSERHGGSGLGFLAVCRLLEEVGRHVAIVPAHVTLAVAGLAIDELGDAASVEWLHDVIAGRRILAAALEDAESSDPIAPATRAEGSGASVRLTGTKTNVAYAAQASHILVPATGPDGAVGLYWVDPNSDGVTIATQRTPDGQPRAQVCLDVVEPTGRLDRGGENEAIRWVVERATAAACMIQLGVLERALEMTAAYTAERVQFERPIGSFQAVHQRAADAYIHLEAVRMVTWEAAWRLSTGRDAAEQVNVAKYLTAELGQSVSFACQHLHGGIGIDTDYPLHRYYRWAAQLEHELGSARHQLDRLGRRIASGGLQPA